MPYRSESIRIAGTKFDSRRKLSDKQKDAIKILRKEGYSIRGLAEMFGVSKWTIQSFLSPAVKPRSRSKPYPKEYWSEAKRKYRQRKQELYKDGKLKTKSGKNPNPTDSSNKSP